MQSQVVRLHSHQACVGEWRCHRCFRSPVCFPAVRNNAALEIKIHQRCHKPKPARNFNPRRCQMSARPSRNGTRVLERARTLIRGGSWWKPSMNIKCKLRISDYNLKKCIWRSLDQIRIEFFFPKKKNLTEHGMTSDALESQKVAFYIFFLLNFAWSCIVCCRCALDVVSE